MDNGHKISQQKFKVQFQVSNDFISHSILLANLNTLIIFKPNKKWEKITN